LFGATGARERRQAGQSLRGPHRRAGRGGDAAFLPATAEKEKEMDLAIQGAIWLGAGVTLVMLLSRRRRRRVVR
jgi:hypothetical protein